MQIFLFSLLPVRTVLSRLTTSDMFGPLYLGSLVTLRMSSLILPKFILFFCVLQLFLSLQQKMLFPDSVSAMLQFGWIASIFLLDLNATKQLVYVLLYTPLNYSIAQYYFVSFLCYLSKGFPSCSTFAEPALRAKPPPASTAASGAKRTSLLTMVLFQCTGFFTRRAIYFSLFICERETKSSLSLISNTIKSLLTQEQFQTLFDFQGLFIPILFSVFFLAGWYKFHPCDSCSLR